MCGLNWFAAVGRSFQNGVFEIEAVGDVMVYCAGKLMAVLCNDGRVITVVAAKSSLVFEENITGSP